MNKSEFFINLVCNWYENCGRKFFWRINLLPPYEFLILEIMLQKTNALAVQKSFPVFIENYKSFEELAIANIHEISNILKPIGLYNRKSIFLHKISNEIIEKHNGIVPSQENDLLKLTGIGKYVANAILCFAYNIPVTLLDVNTARVIGRVFGINYKGDIRRNKLLIKQAKAIKPCNRCKKFNWGLMDISSNICKNRNPNHNICPLKNMCESFLLGDE